MKEKIFAFGVRVGRGRYNLIRLALLLMILGGGVFSLVAGSATAQDPFPASGPVIFFVVSPPTQTYSSAPAFASLDVDFAVANPGGQFTAYVTIQWEGIGYDDVYGPYSSPANSISPFYEYPVPGAFAVYVRLDVTGTMATGLPFTSSQTKTVHVYVGNGQPSVSFSMDSYTANESSGAAQVKVVLDQQNYSQTPVTVQFDTVSGGSATPNSDYVPVNNLQVAFAQGQQEQWVSIPLINDASPGPDKTFNLQLSKPSRCSLLAMHDKSTLIIKKDGLAPPAAPPVVEELLALIEATEPYPAQQNNDWFGGGELSFGSNQPIQGKGEKPTFTDTMFMKGRALVLFQRSPSVSLLASAANLGNNDKVIFQVVRDPDEVGVFGGGLPTLTPSAGSTLVATLDTDANGSFQVLAFIKNKNNKKPTWEAGDQGMTIPLVLVKVEGNPDDNDRTRINGTNFKGIFILPPAAPGAPAPPAAAWQAVAVQAGDPEAPVRNKDKAGIVYDADVLLTGGGRDGKRGLDKVFFGWANNVVRTAAVATYPAGGGIAQRTGTFEWVPAPNRRTYTVGGIVNDAAPANLQLPLLDVSPGSPPAAPGPFRDGGNNVIVPTSDPKGKGKVSAQVFGEKRTYTAIDSPQLPYMRSASAFYKGGANDLGSVQHSQTFLSYLVGWTNSTGGAFPTPETDNSVGFRTFLSVYGENWWTNGTFTINAGAPSITAGAANQVGLLKQFGIVALYGFQVRPPDALPALAIVYR